MEIGKSSGAQSLWELTTFGGVESSRRYTKVQSETTFSGDSVSISDEAKKLYSEMIHKYDHASSSVPTEDAVESEKAPDSGEAQSGQGASGGAGGQDLQSSTSSVESIKKQIQSLKSQLSALASQAQGGNAGVTAKMNALQSQIAALEAQLKEAESA